MDENENVYRTLLVYINCIALLLYYDHIPTLVIGSGHLGGCLGDLAGAK